MAVGIICEKGHRYIQADLYEGPAGAPHCPECFEEWLIEQRGTDIDPKNVVLVHEILDGGARHLYYFRQRGQEDPKPALITRTVPKAIDETQGDTPVLAAWRSGKSYREVREIADSTHPAIEDVIRDQGQWIARFGESCQNCVCYHCGRARQVMSQCKCGAP